MLLRSDRFAPIAATLKKLNIILNTDKTDQTNHNNQMKEFPLMEKSTVMNTSGETNNKSTASEITHAKKNITSKIDRSIASEQTEQKTDRSILWFIGFIVGSITLMYFFFRRRN